MSVQKSFHIILTFPSFPSCNLAKIWSTDGITHRKKCLAGVGSLHTPGNVLSRSTTLRRDRVSPQCRAHWSLLFLFGVSEGVICDLHILSPSPRLSRSSNFWSLSRSSLSSSAYYFPPSKPSARLRLATQIGEQPEVTGRCCVNNIVEYQRGAARIRALQHYGPLVVLQTFALYGGQQHLFLLDNELHLDQCACR